MISFRVVAVPERLERARELAEHVGGEVVLDAGHEGAFPNHVRALRSAAGSHVVVLEDDAILCPDFMEHVARLVSERPDHLLGLYVGRAHPVTPQRALAGVSGPWIDDPRVAKHLWWGVGYVMPTADIPVVLGFLAQGSQHAWINTDRRIGRWHAERGRLSYPFPSLVDHAGLPSVTTRDRAGRVAWGHCGGAV